VSGTLLYCFKHDNLLTSIALSPKRNVLACVGIGGVAQLWDTDSHKPIGQPFLQEDHEPLRCVSFSRHGQYLAYGGDGNKITLWMVQDITLQPPAHTPISKIQHVTQEDPQPEPLSSSFLNGDDLMEEGYDDPYDNFFAVRLSSQSSLVPAPPDSCPRRRLQDIFSNLSVLCPPVNQFVGLQERLKRRFRVHAPANSKQGECRQEGRVGGGEEEEEEEEEECSKDIDLPPCSTNTTPCTVKGTQREELPAGTNTPPPDDIPPAALDSDDNRKLWN
ncbi:hypothetical protein K503DRAFT_788375, partial [Rhizopogon vinicolor AM-OR11-026]